MNQDNLDLTDADLDPESDFIINRDVISKVSEVNEEGESSSENNDESKSTSTYRLIFQI